MAPSLYDDRSKQAAVEKQRRNDRRNCYCEIGDLNSIGDQEGDHTHHRGNNLSARRGGGFDAAGKTVGESILPDGRNREDAG